jgi:nucleotide-binding universal stress UspA family protein
MASGLKRVLVATDFSAAAAAALTRAARLVHATGGELALMHVVSSRDTPEYRARGWHSERGDVGAHARGALQALALEAAARFGILVDVHVGFGAPHIEIAARAQAIDAALVVIGAHRERPVIDMFVGSTAQRLQRLLRAPLLVARSRSLRKYARALVAVDFSPASAEAARVAARLFDGADLHFVHVCNAPFETRLATAGVGNDAIAAYRNQALLRASRELDQFIRRHGLPRRRTSAIVTHGYPPARIRETAGELGATVVALGSRGKSRVEANMLGSVSEQFVGGNGHDVLLVKPSQPRERMPLRRHAVARPDAQARVAGP